MKISVIVPVYNVENVLHYCVDSILAQTYTDYELILIDDGSTDSSGVICDKYAQENDNVIVIHIENAGVSKARNTGIDCAKGEFICFIDSDDYIDKSYLSKLIEAKSNNLDCENIWCGFQTVSDYNGADNKLNLASEEEKLSKYNRSEIMILHKKWLSQMPWNKLFVISIIKNNKIFFSEDLSLGEDLIFNLEYLDNTNGRITIVNKPLNYYLKTGNESLDNKFYSNLLEIYERINTELYKYLKKWHCNDAQFAAYYNSCFYSYEKVLRNTFHPKSNIDNKYEYNKRILKSNEFRTALEKSDCYINKYYRFAFNHSSYRLVRILDRISKIKN